MSEEDEIAKADNERVMAALQTLIEHFDTVQIFVTRHEAGRCDGTIHVIHGEGNYFARLGQISEWVVQERERARCKLRNEVKSEEDDA